MVSISSLTALVTLVTAAAPSAPSFQSNYSRAVALASEQHKPVAVFIGAGEAGYAKLVADGSLPAEATKTLQSQYVCLYVDTTTASGLELAGQFRMSEGLVISDRTGGVQAFRHNGTISAADLTKSVRTYADPGVVVNTTVETGTVVAAPAPVMAAPVYTPAPIYSGSLLGATYAPMYRPASSCPNGRCPNAR